MPHRTTAAAAVVALTLALSIPPARGSEELDPVDGYLSAAADRLDRMGAVTALSGHDAVVEETIPAGDLDGDGLPDLLTVRHERLPDGSLDWLLGGYAEWRLTIRARRGLDGAPLWTFTDTSNLHGVLPVFGGDRPGVLVAAYDAGRAGDVAAWAYPLRLRLLVLDSAGGELWDRAFDGGHAAVNFVGAGGARLPYLVGPLDAVPGTGDDLLVETVDFARNGRTDTYAINLEAAVVAGSTGETVSGSSHLMLRSDWGAEPTTAVAGDLDGDGLDDYVSLIPGVDPEPPALVARRGHDAAILWETASVPVSPSSRVIPLGAFAAGEAGDLGIIAGGTAHLLRGHDGTVAWTRPAWDLYRPGDVNGDGEAEVGTITLDYDGTRLHWRVAALDGGGTVLHESTHGFEDVAGAQSLQADMGHAGDVTGDGIVDTALYLRAAFEDGEKVLHDLVEGATGLAVRPLGEEVPLGTTVTGEGNDFHRLLTAGGLSLAATDGRDGSTVWTAVIVESGEVLPGPVHALDLSGDGLGDVVVNAATAAGPTITVLSGADGRTLWADGPAG